MKYEIYLQHNNNNIIKSALTNNARTSSQHTESLHIHIQTHIHIHTDLENNIKKKKKPETVAKII